MKRVAAGGRPVMWHRVCKKCGWQERPLAGTRLHGLKIRLQDFAKSAGWRRERRQVLMSGYCAGRRRSGWCWIWGATGPITGARTGARNHGGVIAKAGRQTGIQTAEAGASPRTGRQPKNCDYFGGVGEQETDAGGGPAGRASSYNQKMAVIRDSGGCDRAKKIKSTTGDRKDCQPGCEPGWKKLGGRSLTAGTCPAIWAEFSWCQNGRGTEGSRFVQLLRSAQKRSS